MNKTLSEKVECVGVGNRHPDSGEMYCKKCGSNTKDIGIGTKEMIERAAKYSNDKQAELVKTRRELPTKKAVDGMKIGKYIACVGGRNDTT